MTWEGPLVSSSSRSWPLLQPCRSASREVPSLKIPAVVIVPVGKLPVVGGLRFGAGDPDAAVYVAVFTDDVRCVAGQVFGSVVMNGGDGAIESADDDGRVREQEVVDGLSGLSNEGDGGGGACRVLEVTGVCVLGAYLTDCGGEGVGKHRGLVTYAESGKFARESADEPGDMVHATRFDVGWGRCSVKDEREGRAGHGQVFVGSLSRGRLRVEGDLHAVTGGPGSRRQR